MPQYGEVRVDFITYTTGVAPNEGNATVPISGLINTPIFSGDVVIEGNLEVSGTATFDDVVISGNTELVGNLAVSGNIISETGTISGPTITGDTGQYGTITAVTGIFTDTLSGATVTGNLIEATTINAGTFSADNIVFSGDQTISGNFTVTGDTTIGNNLVVSGSSTFNSITVNTDATIGTNLTVSGTISGATVTSNTGNFTSVTSETVVGTTLVSGTTVTGGIIGVGTNVSFPDGTTQTTAATTTANAATLTGIQTFTAAQRGEIDVVPYATNITLDFSAANNFEITLSGNTTLQNPTNIASGQAGAIYIIQGTADNTMAFGSFWDYPGGSSEIPNLTTTSGATDLLVYYTTSTAGIAFRLVQDIKA